MKFVTDITNEISDSEPHHFFYLRFKSELIPAYRLASLAEMIDGSLTMYSKSLITQIITQKKDICALNTMGGKKLFML